MHIPDGFLNAQVSLTAWIISAGGIGYALKKTAVSLKDRMIPLMGVMSAFIFSAQMINFPVFAGTSGHLLGAVLAAVLLGPYAATIVLASVLLVQCLFFQDGGVTALGANIFNMALVAPWAGYASYSLIRKVCAGSKGVIFATAAAAWLSVVLAAFFCALELALSGIVAFQAVAAAMVGMYMLTGAVEAMITSLMIHFVLKVRRDLLYGIRK